jgi:hypothetical protein
VENPLDTIVNMHHAHQWDSTAALLRTGSAPTGHDTRWAQAMAFIAAGHRDDAHLVASVLVIDAEGLVLLARHRRYGRWGPLGGHLEEADAGLPDAAARELLEERPRSSPASSRRPLTSISRPIGVGPPANR